MCADDPSGASRKAERRLSVLQCGELLGNVSEACRRYGIDRKTFYNWRRRFGSGGLSALRDVPRITRRGAADGSARALVVRLALTHPAWGCGRLAAALPALGSRLSSPTVQSLLIRQGLGHRHDRAFRLQQLERDSAVCLTPEQIDLIERVDPAYRERSRGVSRPGERLIQGAFLLATLGGEGRVYGHCVIDACCALAFACLAPSRDRGAGLRLLLERVLPFYEVRGLPVVSVWTGPFPRSPRPHTQTYAVALAELGIEHRSWPKGATNGLFDRFRVQLGRELVSEGALPLGEGLGGLDLRLATWIAEYNARPRLGYPTYGRSPIADFGPRESVEVTN